MTRESRLRPINPFVTSVPYVCAPCRRSFKRRVVAPWPNAAPCPECGVDAVRVARKFKAPPKRNRREWEKVSALLQAGYRFESVDGRYPKTLSDLPEFLATTQPRSVKPYDN
jgi:hypothetical protein